MNFMKRREYFLYTKKIKIMTFFQQFFSSLSLCVAVAPFWRLSAERKLYTLFCTQECAIFVNTCRKHILVLRLIQKSVRSLRSADNLQNGATVTRRDREETNCLKKYIIIIFFAYKKYSRRIIKFRLNH